MADPNQNVTITRAEHESLKAKAAKADAVQSVGGEVQVPRQSGTFRIGRMRHYRNGVFYEEGELITIADEPPAQDWVKLEVGKDCTAAEAEAAIPEPHRWLVPAGPPTMRGPEKPVVAAGKATPVFVNR